MAKRRMLAPINSNKHYVYRSNLVVNSGVIQNTVIAVSKVAPAAAGADEVEEGSIIKAIYCEMWVLGAHASGPASVQFNAAVYKDPGGSNPLAFTDMVNLGSYNNKKNIFWTSQGVLQGELSKGAQAVPLIRTWLMIPKGKQRMGLGDELVLAVSSTGADLRICGMFTYKEFR